MQDYRPLVLRTIDASLPDLKLLRLRLNRHLPAADRLGTHRHPFAQVLCYLSGGGVLLLGGSEQPVRAGSVVFIPRGRVHGFRESGKTRPLCLAMDLEMKVGGGVVVGSLTGHEATRVRHELSRLVRQRDPAATSSRILAASSGLAILDVFLRAVGFLPREADVLPPYVKRFAREVRNPENVGERISALAARSGAPRDYLNRQFKLATGLTLREERDGVRLDLAKRSLAAGASVTAAAAKAGFDDANYFARWFRRKQGLPPSKWKRLAAGSGRRS